MSRCYLVLQCGRTAQFDTLSGSALGAGCRRMGTRFCNCVVAELQSRRHKWNMQKTVEIPKVKDRCPIQADTKHSASKGARNLDRIQRHGNARVQCKTRTSRIRRAIAAGRSAHDIAKQVAMIRENRQDRTSHRTRAPHHEQQSGDV